MGIAFSFDHFLKKPSLERRSAQLGCGRRPRTEDGAKKLAGAAGAHGVVLSTANVKWGRSIADFSGQGIISDRLRAFLKVVGKTVLQRRYERENVTASARIAEEFALGYGGIEGLLVTSLSVPTSTYPAFWCPGYREVELDGQVIRFPWTPLFIRTNMLQHLVVG